MNEYKPRATSDLAALADDARTLMSATADVAGEKVAAARKRLNAALERAKEIAGTVRDKAVAGAQATDEAVHEHPYKAIGIALGVGIMIGCLLARRGSNKAE